MGTTNFSSVIIDLKSYVYNLNLDQILKLLSLAAVASRIKNNNPEYLKDRIKIGLQGILKEDYSEKFLQVFMLFIQANREFGD